MAQTIDQEIRHILDTAYQRAKDIVTRFSANSKLWPKLCSSMRL
ncbi:MAG: hypothetical protein U0401_11930 [Anaerolineae bacterium]